MPGPVLRSSRQDLLALALDAVLALGCEVRGGPKLHHRTYRDRHGRTQQTRTWYANVTSHGKTKPVALGTDRKEAERRLREILGEVARGLRVGPLRLADLLAYVEDDYRAQGFKSIRNLNGRIGHLKRHLGNPEAIMVDAALWASYQRRRLDEGAAPGSIMLERAALLRGFALARRYKRTTLRPELPALTVRNARKGFLERAEFDAINREADPYWQAFHLVCYLTGWRPWTEVRTRQWHHVDFGAGWLRLDPHETKNGEAREVPLIPELRAALQGQRDRCDAEQQRLGRVIPWVFFGPEGQQLFIGAKKWRQARKRAGLGTKLLYDCRRTRVRNFERAGVSRTAGKAWVGHRSDVMYARYGISDAQMLLDAGEAAEAFEEAARHRGNKVSAHPAITGKNQGGTRNAS